MAKKESKKKLLFEPEPELYDRIEHYCALTGRTKKWVMVCALEQYLDSKNNELIGEINKSMKASDSGIKII